MNFDTDKYEDLVDPFAGVDYARAIPDPHRQTQSWAHTIWFNGHDPLIRERGFWFTLYTRYAMERHDGPRTAEHTEQQTAV